MIIFKESKRYNPFKYDTNTSYYNSLIDDKPAHSGAKYSTKDYYRFEKNVEGHIEYMTAKKYIDECSKIFNGDAGRGVRNSPDIDKYAKAMLDGDKFPLPYINYKDKSQEGRHRMSAAAKAFGEDTEFPVLIVTETKTNSKEILDYANKKYPKDPETIVRMVNSILYKDEEAEDLELKPITVDAIELESGDIIEIDDQLLFIDRTKLDKIFGINVDCTILDSGKDRYL